MASAWAGERIRTARAITGITGKELADKSGRSQSLISQLETGEKDLTDEVRRDLAYAIDFPEEFFLVAPSEVPLDSLRFRKYATASKTAEKRAQALFQEGFRVSADLVDDVGYHRPTLSVTTTPDLTTADIVGLAAQTREALQLAPDVPVPHVLRAIERAGVPVLPIVLPKAEDGTSPTSQNRHFGLSYWGGPDEHGAIGFFPGGIGDRDRFTLAHELGHMVMHSKRRSTDAEWEANLFAGEFLMPRDRAQETLGPHLMLRDYARLKATWGISIAALVMRARNVQAIDEARATSLFKQIGARGWRRAEPVEVRPEVPALLSKLVSRLYGDLPLSQLTRRLALPAMLVHSMIPQVGAVTRVSGSLLQFERP